jgi:small subunit ribosomal protein S20
MANHASAEKRNRQRLNRAARNKNVRSTLRTAVKNARVALAAGDGAKASDQVKRASVLLARAASRGVVHTRTAARTTSRIQAALAKLEPAA